MSGMPDGAPPAPASPDAPALADVPPLLDLPAMGSLGLPLTPADDATAPPLPAEAPPAELPAPPSLVDEDELHATSQAAQQSTPDIETKGLNPLLFITTPPYLGLCARKTLPFLRPNRLRCMFRGHSNKTRTVSLATVLDPAARAKVRAR
jgi:hypothetical protein